MGRKIIGNLKFQKPLEGGFDANVFANMMEESYGESEGFVFTQKKTFSPSTVGYGHGNCPRYWFIAFTGAEFEQQFDAMARANMDNGTAAHDRIQKIMAKTGTLKATEIEVTYDDPPIRGFADAFIEWNGKEVVGEIKTAKQEVWDARKAEMKPAPNHLLQLLIYMKIRKVEQGFFFYENKNDQTFLIIPVNINERNKQIANDLFEWMRTTYKAYTENTLPERAFTKSTSSCKYCPVKKACWQEMDEGVVDLPALVPPK
jgi:CRISPR/Cas system-associated exonuclease Cas4 (RecB family)